MGSKFILTDYNKWSKFSSSDFNRVFEGADDYDSYLVRTPEPQALKFNSSQATGFPEGESFLAFSVDGPYRSGVGGGDYVPDPETGEWDKVPSPLKVQVTIKEKSSGSIVFNKLMKINSLYLNAPYKNGSDQVGYYGDSTSDEGQFPIVAIAKKPETTYVISTNYVAPNGKKGPVGTAEYETPKAGVNPESEVPEELQTSNEFAIKLGQAWDDGANVIMALLEDGTYLPLEILPNPENPATLKSGKFVANISWYGEEELFPDKENPNAIKVPDNATQTAAEGMDPGTLYPFRIFEKGKNTVCSILPCENQYIYLVPTVKAAAAATPEADGGEAELTTEEDNTATAGAYYRLSLLGDDKFASKGVFYPEKFEGEGWKYMGANLAPKKGKGDFAMIELVSKRAGEKIVLEPKVPSLSYEVSSNNIVGAANSIWDAIKEWGTATPQMISALKTLTSLEFMILCDVWNNNSWKLGTTGVQAADGPTAFYGPGWQSLSNFKHANFTDGGTDIPTPRNNIEEFGLNPNDTELENIVADYGYPAWFETGLGNGHFILDIMYDNDDSTSSEKIEIETVVGSFIADLLSDKNYPKRFFKITDSDNSGAVMMDTGRSGLSGLRSSYSESFFIRTRALQLEKVFKAIKASAPWSEGIDRTKKVTATQSSEQPPVNASAEEPVNANSNATFVNK